MKDYSVGAMLPAGYGFCFGQGWRRRGGGQSFKIYNGHGVSAHIYPSGMNGYR